LGEGDLRLADRAVRTLLFEVAMRMLKKTSRRGYGWFALPAILLANSWCDAAETAAVVVSPDDLPAILIRDGADKPWRFTKDKDALSPGAEIVGGLGATIDSANGAVQARFSGNISGLSPFPILDTSLTLQSANGADLAFEMSRGRIDLTNRKKAGAATVKLTIRDKSGVVTLAEPGSRLVVEMYSRWPKGVPFTKTPKPTDAPALVLAFIAVKGEVHLKGKEHEFTLQGPPGPAMLILDGLMDATPRVESLDKVPAWIDPNDAELQKKAKTGVKQFREMAEKTSIGEALQKMAQSDEETARRVAVILFGAIDDLGGLAAAVAAAKHQDVVENAIIVLRHWIGRSAGQDLKLYNELMEKGHFKPAEAELVLQLLHSFGDAALKKPETYEALIDFLDCDRMAVRALAHWHLERLVPAGRKIEFKATAAKEEREKAVKAWKELVPAGTVPGREKK
jgi:hypothetical protein